MPTGERIDQVRGLEALARKSYVDTQLLLGFAAIQGTATPTEIDPDDAGVVGVASKYAREDHQHPWPTASAAALTLTGTASEGASTDGARADHVHSTAALPWGRVARQSLTTDSSGFTAPGTADWLLDEVSVDASRLYEVVFTSEWGITVATDRALVSVHADGTEINRVGDTDTVGPGSFGVFGCSFFWEPATGTPDLDVRITGLAGAGTLTFFAQSTSPRQLYVKDIGPR